MKYEGPEKTTLKSQVLSSLMDRTSEQERNIIRYEHYSQFKKSMFCFKQSSGSRYFFSSISSFNSFMTEVSII